MLNVGGDILGQEVGHKFSIISFQGVSPQMGNLENREKRRRKINPIREVCFYIIKNNTMFYKDAAFVLASLN